MGGGGGGWFSTRLSKLPLANHRFVSPRSLSENSVGSENLSSESVLLKQHSTRFLSRAPPRKNSECAKGAKGASFREAVASKMLVLESPFCSSAHLKTIRGGKCTRKNPPKI